MASKPSGGKSSGGSKGSKGGGGAFSILRDEWVIMRVLLPYLAMLFSMFLAFMGAVLIRTGIWLDAKLLTKTQESLDRNTWIVTGLIVLSAVVLASFAWMFWGQRKAIRIKEHATFTVLIAHDWFIFAVWEDKGDWMFGRVSVLSHLFLCVVLGLTWCFRNWAVSGMDDEESMGGGSLADMRVRSAIAVD